MIELAKSPVVFSDNPHGYHLGGKELMGITGLIHAALGLGYGEDTPDVVKNFYIPRAAEYGHAVHSAIENYDKTDEKITRWHKSEEYRDAYDDEPYWEVSRELENYIKHSTGYKPLFNEFTVSDNERYASNIDNGWLCIDTDGIWLIDTKTNNLKYYPGGKSGLQEYLSWQLSVYAYLFERQTGHKVEGLACNWLRGEDHEFWVIKHKPDEDVALLLSTPWIRMGARIEYGRQPGDILKAKYYSPAKAQSAEVVSRQLIDTVAQLLQHKAEIEQRYDMLKEKLREAMEAAGVQSIDNDRFRVTLSAPSAQESFDSKRFKDEHPDIYEQYTKIINKKGSMTIKLKS